MKQKLGLCCSLIHDPDLLILDEPTTGVDPLARRQFWELIDRIRERRPTMSVLVATAYMDEAERFDWLMAMNAGKVLDTGTPAEVSEPHQLGNARASLHQTAPRGGARRGHREPQITPYEAVRRPAGDRGARPDATFRYVHRGGPREFPHRARRDLRIPGLEWLRQDHDNEDADRAPGADGRDCASFSARR